VRHNLRRSSYLIRVALPTAGTVALTSSVALASVLWVSMSAPNMPLLGSLVSERATSVSISLQSALLGIDDGNARHVARRRALARVLGLTYGSYSLPSIERLHALATSDGPAAAFVAQLAVVAPAGVANTSNATTPAAPQPRGGSTATPVAPAPAPAPTPTTDTPPPVIESADSIVVAAAGPAGSVVSYPVPVATDASGARLDVTCVPSSGSVFPVGSTTVTCTAVDGGRKTARTTFGVVVRDLTPPVIHVPDDMQAPASSPAGAVVTYVARASDAVSGAAAIACTPVSGSRFPVGHTRVSCVAEDAANNTSRASFDVQVLPDRTVPALDPHADLTVEASSGDGTPVTFVAPVANDPVDGLVPVLCAPVSGSLFGLGATTVNCWAEDGSHNVGHTAFDVLVRDTTPPAIDRHSEVFAAASGTSTIVAYALPSAQDSVDGVVPAACAPAPGSAFPLGRTMVTCSAQDAAGNRSSTSFGVTVGDVTAPAIQSHGDVIAEATNSSGAAVTYAAPSAGDDVDGPVPVACSPASGSVFPVGRTTVTCLAQDSVANLATSTFDVRVGDTTAPTIQPHASVVAEATGAAGSPVAYPTPTATDSVDGSVATVCAPASGSTFALGHSTVTCTAQDASGNTASSTFDVHVRDTTAPIVQTHADVVAEATGAGGASVGYSAPAANDLVDGAVGVSCAPASGSTFALGHSTVTCTATDAAGNTGSSTFDIHVRDTTAPIVQTHADVVAEATGAAGASVTYTAPSANDLVGGATGVSCAPASGSTFTLGHSTVTCTATDAAGNTGTSTFDIHVRDTTAPTVQSHINLVAEATAPTGAAVTYTAPTASDLVGGATGVSCAPASGSTFAPGHSTVTCTATDAAGNAGSSTFDVHVRDTTAPAIQAHANVVAEATGAGGANVAYSTPSASDLVSGAATVTCAPASATLFPLGHTTVTCSATDAAGNAGTSTFDVHVRDTTAPTVQSHINLVAEATAPTGAAVTYTAPTANDLVGGATGVSCAPASGSTFALGHTTVTCSATDAAGNTGNASFDIHVRDTTAPSVQAHANVVAEATGAAGAAVSYAAPGATDLVDGALTSVCAPASGTVFGLGHSTVTCTATDAAGNNASVTFDVHVRDTTGPTIQPHADVAANATPGGTVVTYTAPTASDAVDGGVAVTCAPTSGSTFSLGRTTVTCSAHDGAGNASARSFDVVVADTTAPVVQSHANIVTEAAGPGGATVSYSSPTASDSFDGPVAVTCAPVTGGVFALGHTTVTCSATDAAGNTGTSAFDVHVRDTTAPTVQSHVNVSAEATGPGGATVSYTAPTASDTVSGSVTVTCAPASGSVFAVGHTSVTCSATDAAGNTGTTAFDVNITDTTAPTLTVPSNMFVQGNSGGAVVTYTASATDLVDGSVPVSCNPPSGSWFPMWQTTVTCTATDAAGNTATRTFNVWVFP
jgi:large repetitive protein